MLTLNGLPKKDLVPQYTQKYLHSFFEQWNKGVTLPFLNNAILFSLSIL